MPGVLAKKGQGALYCDVDVCLTHTHINAIYTVLMRLLVCLLTCLFACLLACVFVCLCACVHTHTYTIIHTHTHTHTHTHIHTHSAYTSPSLLIKMTSAAFSPDFLDLLAPLLEFDDIDALALTCKGHKTWGRDRPRRRVSLRLVQSRRARTRARSGPGSFSDPISL
jgi:hypothetical protein